ncbi:MAG: hypothetical protein RIR00_1316 [Pseudomonadota bacterium]
MIPLRPEGFSAGAAAENIRDNSGSVFRKMRS